MSLITLDISGLSLEERRVFFDVYNKELRANIQHGEKRLGVIDSSRTLPDAGLLAKELNLSGVEELNKQVNLLPRETFYQELSYSEGAPRALVVSTDKIILFSNGKREEITPRDFNETISILINLIQSNNSDKPVKRRFDDSDDEPAEKKSKVEVETHSSSAYDLCLMPTDQNKGYEKGKLYVELLKSEGKNLLKYVVIDPNDMIQSNTIDEAQLPAIGEIETPLVALDKLKKLLPDILQITLERGHTLRQITDLPESILDYIASEFLPLHEIKQARQVCQFFRNTMDHPFKQKKQKEIEMFNTLTVSSGVSGKHTFFILQGKVWGCGQNQNGQLGLNYCSDDAVMTPIQIPDFNNVKQIVVGKEFSLFLKYDGTVWACGNNNHRQLGLNSLGVYPTPVQIPDFNNVKQIAAGEKFSLFLKEDSTVWVTGESGLADDEDKLSLSNLAAELDGDFKSLNLPVLSLSIPVEMYNLDELSSWPPAPAVQIDWKNCRPKRIPGLLGVNQIVAGERFVLCAKEDGSVMGWGNNNVGQLGLGDTAERDIPTVIPGLDNVKQVAAGAVFSLFLKYDGTVLRCGEKVGIDIQDFVDVNADGSVIMNEEDELISDLHELIPKEFLGFDNVDEIVSGAFDAFFIRKDGSVFGWGNNQCGQLTTGDTDDRQKPIAIPALTGTKRIAAGRSVTIIIKEDDTVHGCGTWGYGQLGLGDEDEIVALDGADDFIESLLILTAIPCDFLKVQTKQLSPKV